MRRVLSHPLAFWNMTGYGCKSDVKRHLLYLYEKDRVEAGKLDKRTPTSSYSKPVVHRKTVRSITAIKRYKESKRK